MDPRRAGRFVEGTGFPRRLGSCSVAAGTLAQKHSPDSAQTLLVAASEVATGQAFTLVVVDGIDAGKSFAVDGTQPRVLIGTSSACAIRLADPAVSRRHAAVDVQGPRLRVTDVGSSNGTRVGNVRVVDAFVEVGESIRVGFTTLRVVARDDASNPVLSTNEASTHSNLNSLTYDERDSIETACILKRSEGAASYNNCLAAQLSALAKAPRQPDLSGLSYDEKDAIETACILKRSEGAASYNRCLTAQLGALAKAPRQPDLSGLSYDQKDAVETACILKRSEGAASYNRCLVAQLRGLGR